MVGGVSDQCNGAFSSEGRFGVLSLDEGIGENVRYPEKGGATSQGGPSPTSRRLLDASIRGPRSQNTSDPPKRPLPAHSSGHGLTSYC